MASETPMVTIVMPTYKQEAFIRRAIASLFAQRFENWELLVIDDGSPTGTISAIQDYLDDERLHYHRFNKNQGLGAALNHGLDHAQAPLVAYLPSDDVYYDGHLASLCEALDSYPEAVAAFSGVKHNYNRTASGKIEGSQLQLVQVMHRKTEDRWLERSELVTDDLDRMFWTKISLHGPFLNTGLVSCEWVDHPRQRHKILQEPVGGINPYRLYYNATEPLRFHTTKGNLIDEIELYRCMRERAGSPPAADRLKILMVGELAYNPDRVLALEELGHQLFGLWLPEPYWYNYVGPLPFGNVQDLPNANWKEAVRKIKPDIIYALLNWQAVPFVHHVMMNNPGIPFVWHFKEGPFISLEKGTWPQLVDLYRYSDGQIYSSPEMRDWFETSVPGSVSQGLPYVLDGDLPKEDWFAGQPSLRISSFDGEYHTVVPGRPIGLHPHNVAELAAQGIHLHFYGDFTHGQWQEWIEKSRRLASGYIHLHSNVDQRNWLKEFSQYDAGWLHYFKSTNQGELRQANWDDLNYPARMATLAAAGLPMLQYDNSGSIVATQNLLSSLQAGLFFTSMEELHQQLQDESRIDRIRTNIWKQRKIFTFDYHAPALVDYFKQVIQRSQKKRLAVSSTGQSQVVRNRGH
jgi:glycosyltransferase involved in cell wall biosynthesis